MHCLLGVMFSAAVLSFAPGDNPERLDSRSEPSLAHLGSEPTLRRLLIVLPPHLSLPTLECEGCEATLDPVSWLPAPTTFIYGVGWWGPLPVPMANVLFTVTGVSTALIDGTCKPHTERTEPFRTWCPNGFDSTPCCARVKFTINLLSRPSLFTNYLDIYDHNNKLVGTVVFGGPAVSVDQTYCNSACGAAGFINFRIGNFWARYEWIMSLKLVCADCREKTVSQN